MYLIYVNRKVNMLNSNISQYYLKTFELQK